MPEWKGYEPGSPEAIEAAGKYEPPKAVIQEAPPAKPKPPPTPPTLEPVIPQPYVPPVNAVPVAWHSLKGAVDKEGRPDPWAEDKTKPTVLKTPDGVLYFTPHHKTMWGELGMRNIKDYADYLRTGQPSQYVGITEGVDKPVMVSRRELAKTSELVGEEQFKAMIDVGVIPRGSKFAPGPGGYKGKDWSYIHPDTIKRYKGQHIAKQAASQIELGIDWRLVSIPQLKEAIPRIEDVDDMPPDKVKASGRELLSILVPTATPARKSFANLPFWEKVKLLMSKGIEAEQAKVAAGVIGISAASVVITTEARAELIKETRDMPPVIKAVGKFIGMAVVGGLILAPAYQAIIAGQLVKTTWSPRKVEHLKDVGRGIVDYFISVPAMVALDPALGAGELTGVFLLGPGGVIKMLKGTAARLSPAYIPKRGMAIEYSVSRVPVDKIGKPQLTSAVNKAINQALKSKTGTATVRIGKKGKLAIRLRPTPVSEVVGPALYHATPELSPALLKGAVKGKLFTSPQLAPRFADSTAGGVPGGRAAILMIFTKDKGVKWQPTYNLYKGTKEVEAIYPSGTKLARVKSLRSRLFGEKAGDFITTHDGNIIPIYRFAEQGANVPRFGLAELVAVRLKALQASIYDLARGRKGYEIIKVESLKDLTQRIIKEAEKEVKKGKRYDKAIEGVTRRELRRLYDRNPKLLERLYRERAERFEGRYLEEIGRELERLRRQPFRERIYRATEITRPERARIERERLERQRIERERLERQRIERERLERQRIERKRPEEQRIEEERLREELREERLREDRLRLREEVVEEDTTIRLPTDRISDKKKRKVIKRAGGAICWRQGKLHNKDVWRVVISPYNQPAYWLTVLGRKPVGATLVTGPRSAYESLKLLRGKPPAKKVTADMGIMDVSLEPTGEQRIGIGFTPDPKLKTTSDITIGRKTPPITERPAGLGRGKSPRITPPTPRLRR